MLGHVLRLALHGRAYGLALGNKALCIHTHTGKACTRTMPLSYASHFWSLITLFDALAMRGPDGWGG
jgi:hypothetical protein